MICKPCQHGGELNAQGFPMTAQQAHEECKGDTWCDCQHVVGRTAKAGREPK